MQKKGTARHVGIWMIYFFAQGVFAFKIEKRVSRQDAELILIAIYNSKTWTSHFNLMRKIYSWAK